MNILFVGNSFTYFHEMPKMVQELAQANGRDVQAYTFAKGGHKLLQYTEDREKFAEFRRLYSARQYDLCVLQEYSTLPMGDFDAFQRGVQAVMQVTRAYVRQYMLYETWGFRKGQPQMKALGLSQNELTEKLQEAYKRLGEELGLPVAHVGTAFRWMTQTAPELGLFADDGKHPSYRGSVLAALVIYRTIFHEFPADCSPLKVLPRTLEALRGAAVIANG